MAKTYTKPTWPEFVRAVVDRYLEAEEFLARAVAEGDAHGAAEWRKAIRQWERLFSKYQITIRRI